MLSDARHGEHCTDGLFTDKHMHMSLLRCVQSARLAFAAFLVCRHGGEAADVASAAVAICTDLVNMTINW
jgi:hypothetical protein